MPRSPRTPRPEVSNAAILEAASRVIGRKGARFTLADVGREAGLSAPRLVQRFGSRQRLFRATCEHWEAISRSAVETLARSAAPLGSYLEWLGPASSAVDSDRAAAALELVLAIRRDPALRPWYVRYLKTFRLDLIALLDAAVAAGELEPTDTAGLADRIQDAAFGFLAQTALGSRTGASLKAAIQEVVRSFRPVRGKPGRRVS